MKIWINNPFDYIPGEGARLQRYGLLAQALVKAGHQVIWWSSDWNHLEKARREVAVGSRSRQLGDGAVDIRLIKTMAYFKNIGLKRLISHWRYAREWARECAREYNKPDLIICSAPPLSTGWVMRGICKRLGCVGVIDVMDVWPETFERVAPAWMLGPLRWMAKRVYESADGISAAGDSYLEVVKRYLECANGKPMYRCYHGIEMEEGREVAVGSGSRQLVVSTSTLELPNFRTSPTVHCPLPLPTGNLKLVYVGNMGKGYDLVTLVEAVSELIDEGYAINLDLAGKGEQEEDIQSLARMKKEPIRFHGVVTGDVLRALIEQADVGVVPMFENTYVAVPYKLADYVAAGLPVISSLKGETEELIKRYDAGWRYKARDVLSLKRAIQACVEERQTPYEDLRKQRARQMAEENFDAGKIYPEFVAWLEKLVARKGVRNNSPVL
jgi:glycosyltransferase involved in cell wall biosynthesis